MQSVTFQLIRAAHAALYKRYSLQASGFVSVGKGGRFAPEDPETGAEYRVLSQGTKGNKHVYNRDWKIGLFYPENTFIIGFWGDTEPLKHEAIENFKSKFWSGQTQRVILPNGYNRGKMTWFHGLMYVPVERQPLWYGLTERVRNLFPSGEIVLSKSDIIEIYFEEYNC